MAVEHATQSGPAIWAIVPVKGASQGSKQRLASSLDGPVRAALSHAMLEDVLDQLCRVEALRGVVLVSSDKGLKALESRYPVSVFPEPADNHDGLNGAVAATARHLASQGADTVLVVHGDLPLLSAVDIERLVTRHGEGGPGRVSLVPDARSDGTNALIVTPPTALPFAYGPGSFARHRRLALGRGLAVEVCQFPGLALDIDTPDDLGELARMCREDPALGERRSCRLLADLDAPPVAVASCR